MLVMLYGLFIIIALIVGVFTIAKFFIKVIVNTSYNPSPLPKTYIPPHPPAQNKDTWRNQLQDLYFEGKISLPQFKEYLGADLSERENILKKVGKSAPASTPPSQADISPGAEPNEKSPPIIPPAREVPPQFPPKAEAVPPSKTTTSSNSSGLFSSTSVKTLLLSGAALMVFSASLFVRTRWAFISDTLKFFFFSGGTAIIYAIGYWFLNKNRIPTTAKTLISLGIILIPFNAYGANVLIFGGQLPSDFIWGLGSFVMFCVATGTSSIMPYPFIGALMGGSFLSTLYFGASYQFNSMQIITLAFSLGTLVLQGAIVTFQIQKNIKRGLLFSANGGAALTVISLLVNGFYLHLPNLLPTVLTLLSLGTFWAILSRTLNSRFAYLAGISFLGSGTIMLQHLNLPAYQHGYYYVPAGLLCFLRAWTFDRAKRKNLAQPYFFLGHLSFLLSMASILPIFGSPFKGSFGSLMIIMFLLTSGYAMAGSMYRQAFYTYAAGIVILFWTWIFVWARDINFFLATMMFSTVAFVFLLGGVGGTKVDENKMGNPLFNLALGTISVAMALLAGRWGHHLIATGNILPPLPADQINAGFWTAGLGVVAYGFLARIKKNPAFLYPALLSATWLYVCTLEKINVPVNLLNMSWIVVVSMGLTHLAAFLSQDKVSTCFSLWGKMVSLFILIGALTTQTQIALWALLVCTLAYLPGLLQDKEDQVTGFLMGLYASHFVWFKINYGFSKDSMLALYALYLTALNAGVIFIRTIITFTRPHFTTTPYRVFAIIFSILALACSIFDIDMAWKIFLAYGIILIMVSVLFYEGRFTIAGSVLILISCELFFAAQKIEYIEVYTFPVALYILVLGYLGRDKREIRDFLYGVGQLILYLPSSAEAMKETWEWHGIYLGIISLIVMLFGIHQKNRCLTFISLIVLIANGFIQSHQFFLTVPRWIYLGLGGLTLIGLGGMFEFKRESLVKMKDKVLVTLEDWD